MFAELKMSQSSNSNSKTPKDRLSQNSYIKPERQHALGYTRMEYDKCGLKERTDCMQLKANMSSKGENQASNIIQRKIGFEFQTDCHVYKKTKDGNKLCLPKDTLLAKHSLIDVKTDDNEANYSDLEFITKPLDKYTDIESAYHQMDEIWSYLKLNFVNKESTIVGCNLEKVKVEKSLKGVPQVTFGTSLTTIKNIANAANCVNKKFNIKNDYLDAIKPTQYSELDGLVEIIKNYIRYAKHKSPFNYAKQITDSFLLSRTDFGSLFKLSTRDRKKPGLFDFFKSSPQTVFTKKDWLDRFDEFKEDLDKVLIPEVFDCKEEIPKIGDWLSAIYQKEVDLLSKLRKEDRESMGSMGLDKVYNYNEKKEESAGIFELRCNQGAICSIDGKPNWLDFMRYWYKVIEEVGYLPPSELNNSTELLENLTKPTKLKNPIQNIFLIP